MLSKEDNELLVRTGPGTPMGTFMRRFWAPVMLESELGGPDSAPVRVDVLNEHFVAFRDTAGKIGLIDAYCPHRRANMYWGRNEDHGLRCVYHGWKFDVSGRCTDLPNCPEGSNLAARVKTRAFPTVTRGGIVWAYFGPPEKQPPFPAIELTGAGPTQRRVHKMLLRCNYFQAMEGDNDSSHVSFLHSKLDGTAFEGSLSRPDMFSDTMPRWFTDDTAYGVALSAQRTAGPDKYQWRVTQWLMPFCTLIAAPRGERMLANVRIPIDDERSILFRCFYVPDRDLTAEELELVEGGIISAEMIPGTFETAENAENDYRIDREAQRTKTFTGIRSIVAQDMAVAEDQGGPVADRSREYLVSSDKAIIAIRKRMLTSVKALQDGTEPAEAHDPDAYGVRAVDFYLPRDVDLAVGAKELLQAGAR